MFRFEYAKFDGEAADWRYMSASSERLSHKSLPSPRRGRGVGGEGDEVPENAVPSSQSLSPSPAEYGREGLTGQSLRKRATKHEATQLTNRP